MILKRETRAFWPLWRSPENTGSGYEKRTFQPSGRGKARGLQRPLMHRGAEEVRKQLTGRAKNSVVREKDKAADYAFQLIDYLQSPRVREVLPFSFEMKNRERLNIWETMQQARRHAAKSGYRPVAVFRRNRSPFHVCMELDSFLWLLGG
ncbi:MAG: hypothetical protein H6618_06235 [Deltaproteobacteria bacterium]|nr:hypothetical protein [Deltaproteobacteria bacterium]